MGLPDKGDDLIDYCGMFFLMLRYNPIRYSLYNWYVRSIVCITGYNMEGLFGYKVVRGLSEGFVKVKIL
jgi:hypothetical protein